MVHFSQHMIAVGWDNVAGLAYIGEILPSGDVKFSEPIGANHGFTEGRTIIRLDGLTTTAGKNKQTFVMGMTFPQYLKARNDFCAGGFSGKVTVQTRWMDNAYDQYNAILTIQSEGLAPVWGGYKDVQWTYSDLTVIP